jgi:hypothetical protein
MPYFITSTILFVLGLIIIYWVHSQYHLDIVVIIKEPPPMRRSFPFASPPATKKTISADVLKPRLGRITRTSKSLFWMTAPLMRL